LNGDFWVKGTNLNYIAKDFSPIISEYGQNLPINSLLVGSDSVLIQSFISSVIPNREIRIYANNFGNRSDNYALLKVESPEFPIADLPNELAISMMGFSINFGDKSYHITSDEIYEYDFGRRSFQKVLNFEERLRGEMVFSERDGDQL